MNASLLKFAAMEHACLNALLIKFHAPENASTLIVISITAEGAEKSVMPDLMQSLSAAPEHALMYANLDGLILTVMVTAKPAILRATMRPVTESTITAMETWMKVLTARWVLTWTA